MRFARTLLGGVSPAPHPIDAGDPTGGWWPNPRGWKMRTRFIMVGVAFTYYQAAKLGLYYEVLPLLHLRSNGPPPVCIQGFHLKYKGSAQRWRIPLRLAEAK